MFIFLYCTLRCLPSFCPKPQKDAKTLLRLYRIDDPQTARLAEQINSLRSNSICSFWLDFPVWVTPSIR